MTTQGVERDNVSAMLLFPCLKIKQDLVARFKEFGYTNTYLFWDKREYPFNVMYLVFKPQKFTLSFYLFTLNMEKSVNYVETIDAPGSVVIVYRVPARFDTDYLLFLNGAYSLTSLDFKACFQLRKYKFNEKGEVMKTSVGALETEYTIYYHIFNKTEELRQKLLDVIGHDTRLPRNAELYEKCDITKETLYL